MLEDKLQKIVSLCRRRGFVFGGSELYGGLSSVYDYGPIGARLKKTIKDIWWDTYVNRREDIVGLDSSIIMHEDVFRASGHLEGFSDALVDCPKCKKRFRVDKIEKIGDSTYKCENCKATIDTNVSKPRRFNLMLRTNMSAIEDEPNYGYLRPETAQGIFVNFKNVMDSCHKKLPFGIAQVGKAFRNEVTTGSFIFRMKEFEQMEIEYFCDPKDAPDLYEKWVEERYKFYVEKIGLNPDNLKKRPHQPDELAHYAKACTDLEYNFPFGYSELEGIANRGAFDLTEHARVSRKDLSYLDPEANQRFVPHVIEPSAGVDRTFFALISDAYHEEMVNNKLRVVMKFKPHMAPYRVAIFPLLKNRGELVELAKKLFYDIKDKFPALYDDTGAIGKLYRRQDEIGTPFCVTVDVESLTDQKVTVRERDTMQQERVEISQVKEFILAKT